MLTPQTTGWRMRTTCWALGFYCKFWPGQPRAAPPGQNLVHQSLWRMLSIAICTFDRLRIFPFGAFLFCANSCFLLLLFFPPRPTAGRGFARLRGREPRGAERTRRSSCGRCFCRWTWTPGPATPTWRGTSRWPGGPRGTHSGAVRAGAVPGAGFRELRELPLRFLFFLFFFLGGGGGNPDPPVPFFFWGRGGPVCR